MEAAARKFEEEEDILQECEEKYKNSDDFVLLSSIFSGAENDSYIPYGKISFGRNKEVSGCQSVLTDCREITRPEISDASVSSLSSLESTKRLNIITKVRFIILLSFS